MNSYEFWGWLLVVAAFVSIGLQVYHYRRGVISAARASTAIIARSGFVALGVIYATEIIDRWPRAPLIGLAIVGVGIFLHLANNVVETARRREGNDDAT